MLEGFVQMINHLFQKPKVIGPQEAIVITPSETPRLVIGPGIVESIHPAASVVVSPTPRGAWQEKGWELERRFGQQVYRGYYQVRERNKRLNHRFPGRIQDTKLNITPFIANPPQGIRSHPKGPCFSRVSNDWFQVHWHRPPRNIDDAILYIEKILDEVLN